MKRLDAFFKGFKAATFAVLVIVIYAAVFLVLAKILEG